MHEIILPPFCQQLKLLVCDHIISSLSIHHLAHFDIFTIQPHIESSTCNDFSLNTYNKVHIALHLMETVILLWQSLSPDLKAWYGSLRLQCTPWAMDSPCSRSYGRLTIPNLLGYGSRNKNLYLRYQVQKKVRNSIPLLVALGCVHRFWNYWNIIYYRH